MYLLTRRILESRNMAKRFLNSRHFWGFLQNPRLKLHWEVKAAGDLARFDIQKGNRFDDWLRWRIRRSTLPLERQSWLGGFMDAPPHCGEGSIVSSYFFTVVSWPGTFRASTLNWAVCAPASPWPLTWSETPDARNQETSGRSVEWL